MAAWENPTLLYEVLKTTSFPDLKYVYFLFFCSHLFSIISKILAFLKLWLPKLKRFPFRLHWKTQTCWLSKAADMYEFNSVCAKLNIKLLNVAMKTVYIFIPNIICSLLTDSLFRSPTHFSSHSVFKNNVICFILFFLPCGAM